MNKIKLLSITLLLTLTVSWRISPERTNYVNSYILTIGKKTYFKSTKKQKLGDTITIAIAKLKETDTLFVNQFFSGYKITVSNNSITITNSITIKNEKLEIICNNTSVSYSMSFKANLSNSSWLNKVERHKIYGIYYSQIAERATLIKPQIFVYLKIK